MSLFFTISYLIVEYMRPHSMYESLAGLPLAQFAIIGLVVSFILEGKSLKNSNYQNIFILSYLFWFAFSSMLAFNSELAWQPLADFSKWVIIYFLLINIINDRNKLYVFTLIFLILNFKYAQFAVRIWAANGFYSDPRGLYAGGGIGASFFRNPNDFGVAINSVLGISYYMIWADKKKISFLKNKWLHIICAISMALAVLATSSRGAAVGLGAIAVAIWYKSEKKMIGVPLLIFSAMAFITLIPNDNWSRFQAIGSAEDGSSQSRLELWRAGIRMANENPLTGVGPGNFVYVNTNYYHSELTTVQHNIFIQAASELGYPGLIILLMMIFGCFYNQRYTRNILRDNKIDDPFLYGLSHGIDICIIGFIINGLFITVLYYPFFWMLMILSVALLDIVKRMAYIPAEGI